MNGWGKGASTQTHARLTKYHGHLGRLARIGSISNIERSNNQGIQIVVDGELFFLELAEHIDLAGEKARLSKGAEAAEKERDGLAQRLANPNFTERAKPEAVEKARADHDAKVG